MTRWTRRDFLRSAGAAVGALCLGCEKRHVAGEQSDGGANVVEAQIEQVRKGEATLRFVRPDGKPLAATEVEIRQTGHEFLFGCAIPNPGGLMRRFASGEQFEAFQARFLQLFNYATTENAAKWVVVEPQEGQYRFEDLDTIVEWCAAHGVRLKGHCLVWGTRGPQGVPDWLRAYEGERLREKVRERVQMMVSRYGERIPVWDVVNEPLHANWFGERLGLGYVADALRWAREAGPDAKLIVNEFEGLRRRAAEFAGHAKRAREQGVPLDAIGEQAHDPPMWYSGQLIKDTLDTLATVGVPVHLTEFTYPSDGREVVGGPPGAVWDEETQGAFYEHCYRAFFAHPAVEAITMWALWDGSSWKPGGGILRPDLSPKPAFEALDRLINHEWRTEATLVTDADGRASLHAFFGEYEAKIEGVAGAQRFALRRGGPSEIMVRLG